MPTELTMPDQRSRPSNANREDVDRATRRLIEASVNSIDLWAKMRWNIDQAIASIGGCAHDEALAEALEICS